MFVIFCSLSVPWHFTCPPLAWSILLDQPLGFSHLSLANSYKSLRLRVPIHLNWVRPSIGSYESFCLLVCFSFFLLVAVIIVIIYKLQTLWSQRLCMFFSTTLFSVPDREPLPSFYRIRICWMTNELKESRLILFVPGD